MGKHLHEFFGWPGPITYRQYTAWEAWLFLDMNRPGKIEHYLMQVAAEVRRGYVKEPNDVAHDGFKIPFVEKAPKKKMTAKEATAAAKQRWGPLFGR